MSKKSDRHEPSLFRRILGIVLLALSAPLTLGIAPGFYSYMALYKVVHLGKQNRTDLEDRVFNIFQNSRRAAHKTDEQKAFDKAVRAIHRGSLQLLNQAVAEGQLKSGSENNKNAYVESLIDAAVEYDRAEIMQELLNDTNCSVPLDKIESAEMVHAIMNADVDAVDINWAGYGAAKNTALHLAKNVEVARALYERGATFKQNQFGQTPLHMCRNKEIAALHLRFNNKTIIQQKDTKGLIPLLTNQNPSVQEYLLELTDEVPAGAIAFAKSLKIANAMFKKGADPQIMTSKNQNLLHCVRVPEVAKWLIDLYGLKIDQKATDGLEPIHLLHQRDIKMAKILIGDRPHNYNWGDNIPAVMKNELFVEWLKK